MTSKKQCGASLPPTPTSSGTSANPLSRSQDITLSGILIRALEVRDLHRGEA